ncbi:MAG: hypothetical protein QHH14_09070 [Clostridiales bacterium]|nr:hypothetical protein [Clostridiales bacterium]
MRNTWAGRAAAASLILLAGLLLLAGRFRSGGSHVLDREKVVSSFPLLKALPREICGWTAVDGDQVFGRDNIFDYMDGAGEIYLAFDFQFLFVREYVRPDAPSVVVEIYQMASSEDAFGVFTQDTDGEEADCGQEAIYAAGLLRLWKGDFFVRILADKETPEAKTVVMKMGSAVAAAIPTEGKRPKLTTALPAEGLRPKSLRYFHTLISLNTHYYLANVNILNLSPETQAVMGRYHKEGAQAHLLLVGYPSAGRAFDAYGRFVEMFLLERFVPDVPVKPKKLENGKFAGIVQKGEYLIIVLDADKKTLLDWLLKQVSMNL